MQSDDTRTWSVVHLNKVMCKISLQYVRACRRKLRKTVYFLYSKFKKKVTPSKIDAKWQHSNLICRTGYRRQVQKMDGRTGSQADAEWQHSNLICSTLKQTHLQKQTGGQRPGRTERYTDGDLDGRTSPYHNTARLKTGVQKVHFQLSCWILVILLDFLFISICFLWYKVVLTGSFLSLIRLTCFSICWTLKFPLRLTNIHPCWNKFIATVVD